MITSVFTLCCNRLYQARQRALGLLIIWQLIFLGLSNYVDFFPVRQPGEGELEDYRELSPLDPTPPLILRCSTFVTDHWAQLTGQYQVWWLFAPDFPKQANFPTVELIWHPVDQRAAAESVWLKSSFEPQSTQSYLRLPSGRDRLFLYEVHLGLGSLAWQAERDQQSGPVEQKMWRNHFRGLVQRQQRSMGAYMQWRWRDYQQSHPGLREPDEMIFHTRIYPTPHPGQERAADQQPTLFTQARFFAPVGNQSPVIQWFDPFTKKFRSMSDSGEGTAQVAGANP